MDSHLKQFSITLLREADRLMCVGRNLWPVTFGILFILRRRTWTLQACISSHPHYKNPTPDSWKLPGLTQGSVKCLAQGCLQLLLAPQHRIPLQPGCVVQGLGQGQSHHSPQVTSGHSARLLSLRSEELEAVVLEGFHSRNKKFNVGVFNVWCGRCSVKEGQVTKLWLN